MTLSHLSLTAVLAFRSIIHAAAIALGIFLPRDAALAQPHRELLAWVRSSP
jgi:hypothetical protein